MPQAVSVESLERRRLSRFLRCALWVLLGSLSPQLQAAEDVPAAAPSLTFEEHIRPIFKAHCWQCHGAEAEIKANLDVRLRRTLAAGGDTGPALTPGNRDESLLYQYLASGEMPPGDKKLAPDQIEQIGRWIDAGAPTRRPEPASADSLSQITEEDREFWSYQPPLPVPVPEVNDPAWRGHPIDQFLEARRESADLRAVAAASATALSRRLYFDLWGLPPTPQQSGALAADASPRAYAALVDQLLASPRFGERFARHWLDIVRYGESFTLRGLILRDAWRYRDYVIESFNADRPYDQFLREQIAGDLLPADQLEDHRRQLVATAFWAFGNANLEEQDKRQLDMDVVDEQLDVFGKALLGQTIGCARCHDHKFDPIPTRDYYALAGILSSTQRLEHANVSDWVEVPLPLSSEEESEFAQQEAALAELAARVQAKKVEVDQLALAAGESVGDSLAASALPGIVIDERDAKQVGAWTASTSVKPYIGAGYLHDGDQGKGEKTLTFAPPLTADGRYEVRLAYSPGDNRADRVPVTVFSAEGEKTIFVDMRQPPSIERRFISLGEHRFEAAGQSFVLVANLGTHGHVTADAVQFLPQSEVSPSPTAEADVPASDAARQLDQRRGELERLEKELKTRRAAAPQRPTTLSIVERKEIADAPIHLRGSVHTLGATVPRGFLQVVAHAPLPPLPANQSGRLELANWVASRDNPLTARVFVNRVWHWLFGQGLVRTVDNFGTTGEPPSHPQLLDHLAIYFIEHDWSIKQLVRYIVLSKSYQLSTTTVDANLTADPEYRLCWRANRKRLEAECLRDAMLAISGELDLASGGNTLRPSVANDYGYVHDDSRRSVYVPVLRNSLPELFEVFDFPDPSLVVGARTTSTVAPQALFLLNHPFVRKRAQAAADRLLGAQLADEQARIDHAFQLALGRSATAAELPIAQETVAVASQSHESAQRAWADLYQLLFASVEFRYSNW
jgi:mono/diheme cytochrome c family protein